MNTENIEKALLGFDDESQTAELAAVAARTSISLTPVNKIALNNFAAQSVQKAVIEKNLTKGQGLLTAQSPNLELETRKNWAGGKIMFADVAKYIRRPITLAAGMVDLFQDTVVKEVGICNISKGRFDDGENIMLERIELGYDRGSGITEKTAQFAPVTNTDDAALFNGELEVVVGGRSILRIPVSSIRDPKKDVVGSLANGFNLNALKLIKEKEEIQVRIHFAGTMASTTNADIIEVKFIGDSTKLR